MDLALLILEYLRVLLTWPVIVGILAATVVALFREDIRALLRRVATIKLPGGAEVTTSQSERQAQEATSAHKPVVEINAPVQGLPVDLTPQQRASVEQLIRAERSTSYLWEYRYLNHFLVYHTQLVLDWIGDMKQPIPLRLYDSYWLPLIPRAQEREAIIVALQAHYLITVQDEMAAITPKGIEYREWRGVLPPLPVQDRVES